MKARPFLPQALQGVAALLRKFITDPIAPDYFKGLPEHTVMVERIILNHYAPYSWVVDTGEEIVGVIMAHVGAMPLTPAAKVIEEVIFYIREDCRQTRAAAMLFSRWTNFARKLRDNGDVEAVLMHTMAESPIDMTHHGFP